MAKRKNRRTEYDLFEKDSFGCKCGSGGCKNCRKAKGHTNKELKRKENQEIKKDKKFLDY
jgi:hypothetical protein